MELTPDNIGWIHTEEKGWLWYFKNKGEFSINAKVLTLLKEKRGLTKKGLSLSLGISRPTLDSRIRLQNKWKTLEIKFINTLFDKWVTNQIRNVS